MKAKLLILSALTALVCVSCGHDEMSESISDRGSSSAVENSESVNAPKNIDEINSVDEEATEKGNTPAYEVHVKEYDKDGELEEYTEVKNCFDDVLSSDQFAYNTEYEYKYNSDGIMLEKTDTMQFNDSPTETLYTFRYDEYGELVSMSTVYSYNMETESRYENEYDDMGRLIRSKSFLKYRGEIYDELQNDEQDLGFTEFKYDENGNVIEIITDSSVLGSRKNVCEYDSRGNGISEIETIMKDGEEKRGFEIYTTYNSHDLPETQEWFKDDELYKRLEYDYTFYNE